MGASQSNPRSNGGPGITVVRSKPATDETKIKPIPLPPRVGPILTLEGSHLDRRQYPAKCHLDPQLWMDVLSKIDAFTSSRDEIIVKRQEILKDKIILVNDHVQNFTDSYINDKHKTLAKMKSEIKKSSELEESVAKCQTQAEICFDMLNKLNFLLPEEHKLEALDNKLGNNEPQICQNVNR